MANVVRKNRLEKAPGRRRVVKIAPPEVASDGHGVARESVAVLLLVVGVFLGASLYSYFQQLPLPVADEARVDDALRVGNLMGRYGHLVAEQLASALGWCSFVTVVWAFLLSRTIWLFGWPRGAGGLSLPSMVGSVLGSVGMAVSCAVIASVLVGYDGGGWIGTAFATLMIRKVNEAGTLLLAFAGLVLSLDLAAGVGSSRLLNSLRAGVVLLRKILEEGVLGFVRLIQALVRGEILLGKFLLGMVANLLRTVRRLAFFLLFLPFRLLAQPFLLLGWGRGQSEGGQSEGGRSGGGESEGGRSQVGESGKGLGASSTSVGERHYVLGEVGKRRRAKRSAETGDLDEWLADEKPARSGDKLQRDLKISRGDRLRASQNGVARRGIAGIAARRRERRLASKRREQRETRVEKEKIFQLPPLDLLVSGDTGANLGPKDDELIKNSKILEKALADFNVGGQISEVNPGPVITLYEFQPAAGVKVQRVINLADDLALALKVASVRVFAPVPGKGSVGIEVPNRVREVVRLRDVLDIPEISKVDSDVALALGKDTFGVPFVADLARMPHLLIAGATGTGKSVCINSLVLSLLCRNTPSSLQLLMIDPKMLELSIYEGVPHLKAPVVTNPKHARGVLWWAVEEMERRYRLMRELGVRQLSSYNTLVAEGKGPGQVGGRARTGRGDLIELAEKDVVAQAATERGPDREQELADIAGVGNVEGASKHLPLPRLVIIVDELADLMLTVGREVEELLTRLAQKARAAGIHLILATQRPSVDVITGLIKANFPSRISFQVASRIDARTVLDTSGAEKLLGQGDMLFMDPSSAGVRRLHGAFVSDREVQDVVEWIKDQGAPGYDRSIQEMINRLEEQDAKTASGELPEGEQDPLYDQAVSIVVEKGHASTSMVQRVFRIGYNRAARILEAMEREGVVGPADGAKPRQVYAPNRDLM